MYFVYTQIKKFVCFSSFQQDYDNTIGIPATKTQRINQLNDMYSNNREIKNPI